MKKYEKQNTFIVISARSFKKVILSATALLMAVVIFLLSGCHENLLANLIITENNQPTGTEMTKKAENNEGEMRGVWVSYYELSMKGVSGGENAFRKKAADMCENIKEKRLNTVFLQVRPFSDAFYNSAIFPYSEYLTGVQGENPGYDPLEIFIAEAHKRNLKLHAWINPYRVSYNNNFKKLSKDNPARKIYESGGGSRLFILDNGIYYNPAVPENQKLIIDGVREIAENYDVDGIHIDDYFYPPNVGNCDKVDYDKYISSGGKRALEEWRCDQVNLLVSGMYSAVKAADKGILFGISPSGDIEKNKSNLYADVELWGRQSGFADYLLPQIYFGFENETHPFQKSISEWSRLVTCPDVKLYYGLAAYKAGKTDKFAGSGKNEWIDDEDVLQKQVIEVKKISNCSGYSFYSYSSVCA